MHVRYVVLVLHHSSRKVTLIQSLLIFVIVTLFLFSLVLFYGVQQIREDSFSSFINCIPYAKGLCDYV